MQKIKTFSNETIQSLETEKAYLQEKNEKLKKLLAAKEGDFIMYYNQYQNIATQFDGLKSILNENSPFKSTHQTLSLKSN